jgi:hypothetical protein
MLIPFHKVVTICKEYNINLHGVFHVGAHECEELNDYLKDGILLNNIVWVEGNTNIYNHMIKKGITNLIHAVVDEVSGKEVTFNITNNGQSSSILDLGTHLRHHPDVWVTSVQKHSTKTIQDIAKENNLDFTKYNFWNFDIQGAELLALRGAGDLLHFPDALYLEVNTEKVYKDCALIDDIDVYVAKYGFKRIATHMTGAGWGDALYIKKKTV